jgi:hypothetical protein
MRFIYSQHWQQKKKYRKNISDEVLEHAIVNAEELRDKYWKNILNVVCRVPPSGRILKVVYKRIGNQKIKIITAFWLD